VLVSATQVGPLPPERRRELTRTALVEAAADVFARKGFHGASLDEIAEAAGFTRGAIYSNFKSKEDLLLAVVDWYSVRQLDAFTSVLERAGEGTELDAAADVWARFVHRDPTLLALSLELRLHALRDPEFAIRLAAANREQRERVAALIHEQSRRMNVELRVSPDEMAEISWAASDGLQQLAAMDPERGAHYDKLARTLFEMIGEGLTRPAD
jgi:AcrR family transcriptional regulator